MSNLVHVALAVGIAADVWIASFVALRLRRRIIRTAFGVLALDAILFSTMSLGLDLAPPVVAIGWKLASLWSFALYHPLMALYCLLYIHGSDTFRRRPYAVLLFVPVPLISLLSLRDVNAIAIGYRFSLLGPYLVACLAFGLAEAIAWSLKTTLHKRGTFGLVVVIMAAVVLGPVYNWEFRLLGIGSHQGVSLGLAFELAALAILAIRRDALPLPSPSPPTSAGRRFPIGQVAFLLETRPKYATLLARRAGAAGQPVLMFRRSVTDLAVRALEMPATLEGPMRVSATIQEFADRHPAGVIVFRDFGDIFSRAGLQAAVELVSEAAALTRSRHVGLVVSGSALTPTEVAALEEELGPATSLPRPEDAFEAIIGRELGSAARRILEGYARSVGGRREDLAPSDVPFLVEYMRVTLAEVTRISGEEPLVLGWGKKVDRIEAELDRFARLPIVEVACRSGPSPVGADRIPVVRAADYWESRPPEEAPQPAAVRAVCVDIGERVRQAFLESLGPAGSHLFNVELRRIRRRSEDLSRNDVCAIAENAPRVAADLVAPIDLAAGRSDLDSRAHTLRQRLLELAGSAV